MIRLVKNDHATRFNGSCIPMVGLVTSGSRSGDLRLLNAVDTNYATGKTGAPLDAVLFLAKGSPKLVDGMVQMNMSPQLRDIETGFRSVTLYP